MHKEERQNNSGVTDRKPIKNRNSLAYFPAILSQQILSTEVKMFSLLLAAEIKDLPIQRTYSWTDLHGKFVLFNFEQHFG